MRLPHLSAGLVKESHLPERLRAWWKGYYFGEAPEAEPEAEAPSDEELKAPGHNGR